MTTIEKLKIMKDIIEESEKYRWHDLRKDPDDLPDDFHSVLICLEGFDGDSRGVDVAMHSKFTHVWGTTKTCYEDGDVIAWREIEPFEEVE